MDNAIDAEDKELDDASNGDFFFTFDDLDLEEAADFFPSFFAAFTTSQSLTRESTFDSDVDDDFAGVTIAADRPPPPTVVVLDLPFFFTFKVPPSIASPPGDLTWCDRCNFFSFFCVTSFHPQLSSS